MREARITKEQLQTMKRTLHEEELISGKELARINKIAELNEIEL